MKRSLKTVWAVPIVVVCLLAVGFSAFSIVRIYRWFNPYLDQPLAGPTTITAEWLEITPKSPLRISRQRHLLSLDLDKSIRTGTRDAGLKLPDDSIVRPQVELISDDGKTYELNKPSLFDSKTRGTLAYFTSYDLTDDKTYVKVRIRSDKPFRCNRIFWRNYNLWDAESLF